MPASGDAQRVRLMSRRRRRPDQGSRSHHARRHDRGQLDHLASDGHRLLPDAGRQADSRLVHQGRGGHVWRRRRSPGSTWTSGISRDPIVSFTLKADREAPAHVGVDRQQGGDVQADGRYHLRLRLIRHRSRAGRSSLLTLGLAPIPSATLPCRVLAPGVYAVLGDTGRGVEGRPNAGFVVTTDGVVVIDALASPRAGRAAARAPIRRVTDRPVKWLVLTHHHPDHHFGAIVCGRRAAQGHRAPRQARARLRGRRRRADRGLGPGGGTRRHARLRVRRHARPSGHGIRHAAARRQDHRHHPSRRGPLAGRPDGLASGGARALRRATCWSRTA